MGDEPTYAEVRGKELGHLPLNPVAGGEWCQNCGRLSGVGFNVPSEVWRTAVPARIRGGADSDGGLLCIVCFAMFADERLIPWDEAIEFHPVSLVTAIRLDTGVDLRTGRAQELQWP